MQVLIDNHDIEAVWGIKLLDWTEALGFAMERESSRVWEDKSGTDESLVNRRYDSREFSLNCYVKVSTTIGAYEAVKSLVDYMFSHTNFILSFRHEQKRLCMLCCRSSSIAGTDINIRKQNTLYVFKLGLKDVNPNALKIYTQVQGGYISIPYTKGKTAVVYYGDGLQGVVSNTSTYLHETELANGTPVESIIDVDVDTSVTSELICDFRAENHTGILPDAVQFTDLSTGGAVLWSWDFGDGESSILQNPSHTYKAAGVYTVKLQIFNAVQGTASMTKVAYITVERPRILITSMDFLLSETDTFILKQ